jgi:hypothetical protein
MIHNKHTHCPIGLDTMDHKVWCAITWLVLLSALYLLPGIYGLVFVIQNGSDNYIWGGIGLMALSVLLFYCWCFFLLRYIVNEHFSHVVASKEFVWKETRHIYCFALSMLYALLLVGIAILPNSGSPDIEIGVCLLAIFVPLCGIWWSLEVYHKMHVLSAK